MDSCKKSKERFKKTENTMKKYVCTYTLEVTLNTLYFKQRKHTIHNGCVEYIQIYILCILLYVSTYMQISKNLYIVTAPHYYAYNNTP